MNSIMKKITCLCMIIILGYTQIGCQSEKEKVENNTQIVKDYSSQDSNEGNNQEQNNKDKSTENTTVESTSNAELHFIDTGNSDAILIVQDGKAALIDGGDNDDEKLVVSYLNKQGIKELEYVFATHPHADHIGGLDAVASNIKIKNLYVSNGDADTKSYRDFIESAASRGLSPSVPILGSEFKLGTSTFKVLSVANGKDPNNNSIVLLYTNGNDKVLLMGDAEEDIERTLNPGQIDLLKVGHHGSHSSSSKSFIDKIKPQYGVILVGTDNKYGHPHKETMNTLSNENVEIHRSDECGNIVFTSTGNGLEVNCKVGSYNTGSNSTGGTNKEEEQTPVENNQQPIEDNQESIENNQPNDNSQHVYWSTSGKKYHSDPNCSSMKSPIAGTIEESGRTPCSKCY
ncbi:ComEC/Rec2 family competence protein [Romboutsia sp.]|uniref:ComEC/Rec2 family competence protein n=1 Tax=Romboutsia sp. TaxID=1965302 RepID=UPI003F320518